MNSSRLTWSPALKTIGWGLLAFVILTLRFSPNWAAFYNGVREARNSAVTPAQRAAVDGAILSGYSARGFYVIEQAANLSAEIPDLNHKIVRWRLLMPVIGHVLHLPGWLLLGLAHIGCLLFIITLVSLFGAEHMKECRGFEAMCFAIVAGASAPFFTSMGLLGYYDVWLSLGLLGVSFARKRWVVIAACILAPWIDERFVIGLPLALCVRWIQSRGNDKAFREWIKTDALIPVLLAVVYTALRLSLGGTGSSQTVQDYLNEFVFAQDLSIVDYIAGAWAGLRVGWLFVAAAVIGTWTVASTHRGNVQAVAFGLAIGATALIGLFTALDLSRSMLLLITVVPLGWAYARRTTWWSRFHLAPLLAMAALVLPASHVVGRSVRPVDNLWSPPTPLTHFQNTLGVRYLDGDVFQADAVEAVNWFRKAADHGGLAEAQFNLGLMCIRGEGTPQDGPAALKWFRAAAEQGFAKAQHKLAVMYAVGEIVPKDDVEAARWYHEAAENGFATAQSN